MLLWLSGRSLSAGRECVYPEVNRNYNIGEKGVNMNSQVFKQYLTQMSFNQELVYHTAFVVHEQRTFIPAASSLQSQLSLSLHVTSSLMDLANWLALQQSTSDVSVCSVHVSF